MPPTERNPFQVVEFSALDVSKKKHLLLVPSQCWWRGIKQGLNYVGTCNNSRCIAHTDPAVEDLERGTVVCNKGVGALYRPNEDYDFGDIYCPACLTTFLPARVAFRECSVKIDFCFKGERPTTLQLRAPWTDRCAELGNEDVFKLYTSLLIDVQKVDVYKNREARELRPIPKSAFDSVGGQPPFLSKLTAALQPHVRPCVGGVLPHTWLDPRDIRYIQDSIASFFRCGRSVKATMNALKQRQVDVMDIPIIHVFRWKGECTRRITDGCGPSSMQV